MSFLQELEHIAEQTATSIFQVLSVAYLNKATGVAGAPALTARNIGRIAGVTAAHSILSHLSNVAPAAEPAATQPPAATPNPS